ncbi:hypothetical protein KUTeg_016152 [Tegillarca granosa]|uniref:NIPA-like protein 2 n=1 Tax=Tegillarca granosa TaxID=220873 RepID=A0ABQ9EPS8_TEGGR|nr:hypothetical protein KUTeg_016152 [Tegillarca granosa]
MVMATTEDSFNVTAEDHYSKHIYYQDLLIGCILAIGGNLLISISLNLQKFTHLKNAEKTEDVHYTQQPLWWIGLSLMVIGEIGNFSAYGYAPASLVAPLGTTTVVANLFLAAAFLKEKIRAENLFGIVYNFDLFSKYIYLLVTINIPDTLRSALAVIGAFLLVTFAPKKDKVFSGSEVLTAVTQVSFIIYVTIEVVALVVLFIMLYKLEMNYVVVILLITSITASFTVISAKAVSGMLQLSVAGYSQFMYPMLYIMILVMTVTAVIQIKYLNLAMKNFNSTVVVPTNFVFFTISAIMAGIIFYKEFWGMKPLDICMFLIGCLMSFVGVYFITMRRASSSGKDEARPTEKEEPPKLDSAVVQQIFPSWLLADVNVGEVQPKAGEKHLEQPDERNLVRHKGQTVDSSSSQETLVYKDDSFDKSQQSQGVYGATEK